MKIKHFFSLSWLLMQVVVLAASGYGALALMVFWLIGLWGWISNGPPRESLKFALLSACLWFLVIGYVVAVRKWWPYAKGIMRANGKQMISNPSQLGE